MENTPEFPAVDAGLPRRTVLTGAAWTIPVIAAATIAPNASASGTLQLAFDKTTYNGTACSTITGAYVTATTNGVPTTGASITVSLSGGYAFVGGATSASGVSNAQGRYSLEPISVPASGGTGTVTATAQTTASSASMNAQAVDGGFGYFDTNLHYNNAVGIPAGSTPALGSWFLTPDNRLIEGADGSTKHTDIDTVGPVYARPNGVWFGVALKPAC